ncbi:hypothetical protein BDC45DRAFT_450082, partial [Circinella umbellata]
HNRTHSDALVYIGYPLYSTSRQLDRFMTSLLTFIQQNCPLHERRGLSIRGRATILNVLILSRLWHILRVTGASIRNFHTQLRSIISKFLLYRMFPKISYQTMCLP